MAWYNTSWNYRVKVTVDHTKVGGSLTNFPVYLNLAELPAGFHTHVKTAGADIRMTSSDGTTEIPVEIVFYDDPTDTGELHFKAPSLSSSVDDVFYVYYGNAAATLPTSSSTYGKYNVWDANYLFVYHGGAGSSLSTTESTVNQRTITAFNTPTAGTGKIGGATVFAKASSQYMELTDHADFRSLQNLTIEAWCNLTSVDSDGAWIFGKNVDNTTITDPYENWAMFAQTDRSVIFRTASSPTTGWTDALQAAGYLPLTTWTHMVATYDHATMRQYKNGTVSGTTTSIVRTTGTSTVNPRIATFFTTTYRYYWDGKLDEIRLSKVARSSTWISTQYNNQNSTSTFYTPGAEESQITTRTITGLARITATILKVISGVANIYNAGTAVFVNRVSNESVSAVSNISAPAANHVAGNLLVALVSQQNNGAGVANTITDTAGNTWYQAGTTYASASLQNYLSIYYAYNITGNAANVVNAAFSPTPSGGYCEIKVLQFSGFGTSDPFGAQVAATGTSTTPTSPSVTTIGASSVIVGWIEADYRFIAAGSGFTAGGASPSGYFFDEYKIVSASQTAAATCASGDWRITAASFNASPSVTTTKTETGLARITNIILQTITGKGRITASTLRTIAGLARITASTLRTVTGISRITASTLQVITGIARITASALGIETGVARITVSTTNTEDGTARISIITPQIEPGKARIQVSVDQSEPGVSRITSIVVADETGVSRVTASASTTEDGLARIQRVFDTDETGVSRVTSPASSDETGVARVQDVILESELGLARIQEILDEAIAGVARIARQEARDEEGVARMENSVSQGVDGVSRVSIQSEEAEQGVARISGFGLATISGVASILAARVYPYTRKPSGPYTRKATSPFSAKVSPFTRKSSPYGRKNSPYIELHP